MISRVVYVNGQFLPEEAATVSIFDRGFDESHEQRVRTEHGKLVDNDGHLRRLERSLGELAMPLPLPLAELVAVEERLIAENHLREGVVYMQVTRGSADRDFVYDPAMRPTLVLFTQEKAIIDVPAAQKGLRVMAYPDIRWGRRDIKTTQLLAQSLAKMAAKAAGFDDAWMVAPDGFVTEGSSNNVWMIKDNTLTTRPATHDILNGITRQALFTLLQDCGLVLDERPFTIEEAKAADEALMSAAGSFVLPVVEIDGVKIGDGKPGKFTRALREGYIARLRG